MKTEGGNELRKTGKGLMLMKTGFGVEGGGGEWEEGEGEGGKRAVRSLTTQSACQVINTLLAVDDCGESVKWIVRWLVR